jgi:hypothetical protein
MDVLVAEVCVQRELGPELGPSMWVCPVCPYSLWNVCTQQHVARCGFGDWQYRSKYLSKSLKRSLHAHLHGHAHMV